MSLDPFEEVPAIGHKLDEAGCVRPIFAEPEEVKPSYEEWERCPRGIRPGPRLNPPSEADLAEWRRLVADQLELCRGDRKEAFYRTMVQNKQLAARVLP